MLQLDMLSQTPYAGETSSTSVTGEYRVMRMRVSAQSTQVHRFGVTQRAIERIVA